MQSKEKEIAGKNMRLETGRMARQSNGSVLVSLGETTVLATVNAAKEPREDIDFFPLQVEYREKHYAGGKIPGGFLILKVNDIRVEIEKLDKIKELEKRIREEKNQQLNQYSLIYLNKVKKDTKINEL